MPIEPGGPWDTNRFVDWLAGKGSLVVPREINRVRMVRHVATRRPDTSTSSSFSCIFLIAFVSQASHHQYIEFPMDWTEFFPLQDCTLSHYVHTYNTKDTLPWRGGYIFSSTLFIHFSDLHFLFVWAASIPERRTRTQCLSLSSSSSVLKSAASFLADFTFPGFFSSFCMRILATCNCRSQLPLSLPVFQPELPLLTFVG